MVFANENVRELNQEEIQQVAGGGDPSPHPDLVLRAWWLRNIFITPVITLPVLRPGG